jgi:hypothetical protein
MKKTILILTIAFGLCAINKATAQTVASGTTGACTWTITGTSGNYTLTISGNGAMDDYEVELDADDVPWYVHRSGIKTLDIQQGVTTIGDAAFLLCSGLTSVLISNSVTTIEHAAFAFCSGLTSVTIGNSVTTIGYDAFYDCTGLTSVIIGNSLPVQTTRQSLRLRPMRVIARIYIVFNLGCKGMKKAHLFSKWALEVRLSNEFFSELHRT